MRIDLDTVSKRFGDVVANDRISLTLEAGKIHGLVGENGAGKSTLVKILSGFYRPDRGRILLDGRATAFASPRDAVGAGIGMLHQDPLDFPALSVLDDFLAGAPSGHASDRRAQRIALADHARRFGFALDPAAKVGSLSVGERQQLEILRLLSLGVGVLILDEPTTALSGQQRETLFRALRALARDGTMVIFVSHKLEEVEALCDEVTVLTSGRVVGRAALPCPTSELVRMMFGTELTRWPRQYATPGEPVVELDAVTVADARLVVPNLSFVIREGEAIGIAGLEGSGQRLFVRAACGLVKPATGRVRVGGQDLTGASYRQFLARGIQYVPAARLEEGLIGPMTVAEHVALASASSTRLMIDWSAVTGCATRLIGDYDIRATPVSPAASLSGGNQQRLLLGLLPNDLALVAVEHPTRGLDLASSASVWRRLTERMRRGTAVLFVSSDLDELLEHSDRIEVFFEGRASEIDAHGATTEHLGEMIGGVHVG